MKIYLVKKHYDNTYDYDDDRHQYSCEVIACAATEKKAKDFIKAYTPGNYYKHAWIEGDPENRREKLMVEKKDIERIFHVKYINFSGYYYYHILWLTITEMEVIE